MKKVAPLCFAIGVVIACGGSLALAEQARTLESEEPGFTEEAIMPQVEQPPAVRWDDATGTYVPVAGPAYDQEVVPHGPYAEIRVFGGAAEVFVDDSKEMLSITDRQLVEFEDTLLVKLYKSGSVDFGEHGFIRLDAGWVHVYLDKNGNIRVVSQGARVFADGCKNLVREGRGRWMISR